MEFQRRFAKLISTWFGSGLIRLAPGSLGSLLALPFAWVIFEIGQFPALMIATLIVFAVGIWATNVYIRDLPDKDPPEVVIDEVAGQWLTLLVVPADLLYYAIGFIFFRIADILKPWPVSWADQRIKGCLGIMLDDIFAGIYSAIALLAVRFWLI